MSKIKVGAVSYLNTKPLLYGIKHHPIINEIELTEEYPSLLAKKLIDGSIDVGLVPVATLPYLKEWFIVADYCIGCDGPVASVCLFSEVPMEEIEKIYLDYQSRTSVMLLKILLKEYWQKEVEFIEAASEEYRNCIKGTAAGLVIGDRALEQKHHSTYCYDLGEAWKNHTGLPFVFAAWVSNKKMNESFVEQFNEANRQGLDKLDKVIAENDYPFFSLTEYYTRHISYKLDEPTKNGMMLFLKKITST